LVSARFKPFVNYILKASGKLVFWQDEYKGLCTLMAHPIIISVISFSVIIFIVFLCGSLRAFFSAHSAVKLFSKQGE